MARKKRAVMISSGMGPQIALKEGSEGEPVQQIEVKQKSLLGGLKEAYAKHAEATPSQALDAALDQVSLDIYKHGKASEEHVAALKEATVAQQKYQEALAKAASLAHASGKSVAIKTNDGPLPVAVIPGSGVTLQSYGTYPYDAWEFGAESGNGVIVSAHESGDTFDIETPPEPPVPDYIDAMLQDRHRLDNLEF
jgi:hypothetical protein